MVRFRSGGGICQIWDRRPKLCNSSRNGAFAFPAGAALGWTKVRGLRCAGWCRPPPTLRCAKGRRCLSPRGTLPPVRDAGLAGAGQSTCARLVPRILGPWHLVPARRRGCRFWSGLCTGDRAALALALHPHVGTAGAVCPFGPRAAKALPCVPACRPSRADGGDTGFESRNRCYLLIYSMETVFLCIGRTRRAHERAWATFPARQAGMWANDATGRHGALSPALLVSALRVTARPIGMGDAGGWLGVCLILCVRPALSLRVQERRGGKSGIEPFMAKWPIGFANQVVSCYMIATMCDVLEM